MADPLRACCEALDDKKAKDILVLHFGAEGSIADDFILATGTSEPHLRALVKAVETALSEQGREYASSTRGVRSGWMVIDAYDFIIHVFTDEMRRFYNLEGLWRDARRIEYSMQLPSS